MSTRTRAGAIEPTLPRISIASGRTALPRSKMSHLSCLSEHQSGYKVSAHMQRLLGEDWRRLGGRRARGDGGEEASVGMHAAVRVAAAHDMASIRCPPGTSQYVSGSPSTASLALYPGTS